jgi:arylsulfatase A-like enzyme
MQYAPSTRKERAVTVSHLGRCILRLAGLFVLGQGLDAWRGLDAGASPQTSQRREPWSILLVTVDCLRPDHMSLYGYTRDTTPHLDRIARESLVFENAFATSAWTVPGVVSLVTGYDPPVHGQNSRYGFYDREMPSPLRVLAEEGYDVLGSVIRGPGNEDFGFQAKPATQQPFLEHFVRERASNPKPFFAWIHLNDVHLPYRPSPRNSHRWMDTSRASDGVGAVREHHIILKSPQEGLEYKHASNVTFVEDDLPTIRALYDGEVADLDERLGSALDRMRKSGLLRRTIVVVTADHGEELFDHGWIGHASTSYDGRLYDELIRIPLIIRLPDRSRTGRFDALVQGVDLMPTLFEILGVDPSRMDPPMQGRSLMDIATGKRREVRTHIFTETTLKGWTTPKDEVKRRVLSVRTKDRKLLLFPEGEGHRIEAYDLRADPGETENLHPRRAAEFADLAGALTAWRDRSRETAARLVLEAASRRRARFERALQEGDLPAAVHEWEAVEVMHRTWGLEPEPFYAREPHASAWKTLRGLVAEQIGAAIGCSGRDRAFRLVPPGAADLPASVVCAE